ncbi:hypothetical protein WMF45_41325 [Sorangium sp. So ce448]|uniref:hypothetical protein n=1 Tax=Sorangium sp. So ce448 TaxID=3133314 RepID=UPI003F60A4DF
MDLDAFPGAAARRALLAAALVLAFGVAHGVPGAREAAAAEPLVWVAPGSAGVVPWSNGPQQGAPAPDEARAAPAAVDPTAPVALAAGQLLLVPVEPGDRLEVRGDVAGIGLGSGIGSVPDVITWMPLPPARAGARDVAVPAWSSARFVVVRAAGARGAGSTPVAVRVAARESAPLAWYRLDEDVAAWLGGRAPAPATAPGEAGALLRWVDAARAALSAPAATGAPSARLDPAAARLDPAAAAWLTARYLEESLLVRPLVEPYFAARGVELRGGREGPDLPAVERATPWRSLGAGARLELRAPGADVLRIALRARTYGTTRVVVRAGGAVVRELVVRTGSRLADAARWSEPRWIRVPLPVDARAATVDVVEGELAVAASGYQQRSSVAELLAPQRDRAGLLDRAARRDLAGDGDRAPVHAEAPRLLAAADRAAAPDAAKAALDLAARPAVPLPLRALVLAESVRWAPSSGAAFARAAQAYTAAQASAAAKGDAAAQGRAAAGATSLQRAILARLAAAHADPGAADAPWSWRAGPVPAQPGAAAPREPAGGRAHPDDVAAVSALGAAMSPPRDGRRPAGAPLAERYALGHGDVESAAPLARTAWAREAPWDALDIPDGVAAWSAIAPPRDVLPPAGGGAPGRAAAEGVCEVDAASGLRWTLLDAARAQIDVEAPPGAHARVLLRSASSQVVPESPVLIDGAPTAVHGGAGLTSVVAVAPGARTFQRPAGAPPVLARIPRSGRAPCASLREIVQWAWVDGSATFALPDPERATLARVVLAPPAVVGEAALVSGAQGVAAPAPGAPGAAAPASGAAAPAPGARGAPPPADGPARVLRVRAGAAVHEAWVRAGATGSIEVPVPAGAHELRVETDAPTLLRASVRLHPAAPGASRAVTPVRPPDGAPVDGTLEQIRGATRALRAAPSPARAALHAERAGALDALGFPALAALDRPAEEDPWDAAHLPGASTAGAPPSTVFTLPPGSPVAVPLGLPARVPPLPLPDDRAPLAGARGARAGVDPRRGVALLAGPAGDSSGADALLLGLLAERSSEVQVAADAFTRIGLAHRSAAALARASNLATDVASAAPAPDRRLTLRALVLAELAVQEAAREASSGQQGAAPAASGNAAQSPAVAPPAGAAPPPVQLPPAALARLAPVTGWTVPPRADATAGTATLEIRARADRDLPLRVRVRRALVDAPEASLLITDGARAEFRLDRAAPGAIVLDGVCRALDREETPCAFSIALDGEPVACSAASAPMADRCVVQVPRGSHRIEARPPADRSVLGWIRATAAGAAQPFSGRVLSTWNDIDPARPLELAFVGPTVVRIRARAAYECASPRARAAPADGGDPACHPEVAAATPSGQLRFSVAPLDGVGGESGGGAVEEGTLALDASEDRAARRLGVTREPFFWLGGEVESRVAVLPEGPHVLRVASPGGRALLRVELAVANGAPRPRVPPPAPPPLPAPIAPADELLRPAPPVGEDPDPGPLSVGGYARLVDSELAEEDARLPVRFLELGLDVHRELIERRAWIAAAGFGRLRDGPESFGAEARFDMSSSGWVPGGSLSGRVVFQPDASEAMGARASASAFWSIPLGELTLSPWAGFTWLMVDESLRGFVGADKDVYTPYGARHDTQASLGARLRYRPFVDALVTAGTSLRLSPVPSALDRIDATLDLDLLPGRGLWPWIQLGWLASYRPVNETRDEAFLRDAFTAGLTFWSWLARGHRVSLGAEGTFLFDLPSPAEASPRASPRVSGLVFLRYDYTARRGLRDFPPASTPFRDRQEEGSGRIIERERPAVEPSWEEP